MCNCITEVSEKLTEKVKSMLDQNKIHSFEKSDFENICLMFSDNGFGPQAIGLPFTVSYWAKKKDGTRATKQTHYTRQIFMSYCPFCGEKIEKQ